MNTGLLITAGAGALAYYYRAEIAAQFGGTPAAPAITAATTAASTATAGGLPPVAAATAAVVAAAATPPSPINPPAPNSVALQVSALIAGGIISPGSLTSYCKAQGAPDVPSLTQTVSQWNWYLTNWQGIPGQALGDDGTPVTAGAYISLLSNWARNNGA